MIDAWAYEKEAQDAGYKFIAGVDEAGRGPLAGPVVAAACIIPNGVVFPGINDSKKLSAKQREALYHTIVNEPGVYFGIGIVHSIVIDQINILQATFRAMLKAVHALEQKPDYILVDGNRSPHFEVPSQPIIQGDALSQSIMAASILAKYIRDLLMTEYHEHFSDYGFNVHKGYGTKKHLTAIEEIGPCCIHRKTFAPIKK